MLRDVHNLLRGGRGAVVTALADVHRMVGPGARGPRRKPGALSYAKKRLSLSLCLFISQGLARVARHVLVPCLWA